MIKGRAIIWISGFVVLCISFAGETFSQEKWTKLFGGENDEWVRSVLQTSDGGFLVVGHADSFVEGSDDIWLNKFSITGEQLWTKTYGGTELDTAESAIEIDDGFFIIGSTSSFGAGKSDIWLLRVDAGGDTLWTKTYGGLNSDREIALRQTQDGGLVLLGNTFSYGSGNCDWWLIKTDSSGIVEWDTTFGGEYYDLAADIRIDRDGGFVITGLTQPSMNENEEIQSTLIHCVKTYNNGKAIWKETYKGLSDGLIQLGRKIFVTDNGNYVIQAQVNDFPLSSDYPLLLTINDQGKILEYVDYKEYVNAYLINSDVTFDGGYIMCGTYSDSVTEEHGWLLVKTDNKGVIDWVKKYRGHYASSVISLDDGRYAITGIIGDDAFLVIADNDGEVVDIDRPVFVKKQEDEFPEALSLLQNSPNPFNGSTIIPYNLKSGGHVLLMIYDCMGQNIRTLVNSYHSAGTFTSIWDGTDNFGKQVSSGIYYYSLRSAMISDVKKMMFLK